MGITRVRNEQLKQINRFAVRLIDVADNHTVVLALGGDYRISNRAITIVGVGAYVDVAGVTGLATINIKEAGTTILSTKITIDSAEKTSETAATLPVISDTSIAADAVITFDIDVIQTTAAKGLVVWLTFVYT